MPFPYYRRLSKSDKAIYRASDRIADVPLPDPAALRPRADAVHEALEEDDRVAVERAAQKLVSGITRQLDVLALGVRVLAVPPRSSDAELHGLYVREEGARPVVHVWMRTAAHRRVVAFRTFLRTLFHELCHHLDYELYDLADSFHTEGFFRRESSLVRQVAPREGARERRPAGARDVTDREVVRAPEQLDLPI